MGVNLVAAILTIAALAVGREFFIPLAMALCFHALLRPVVRNFERLGVPSVLGATVVVLSLLGYHQLSAGHFDLLLLFVYLGFVAFLGNRARRLKSRVAELVDLAAHRAGLQRIPRRSRKLESTPVKTAETVEVG